MPRAAPVINTILSIRYPSFFIMRNEYIHIVSFKSVVAYIQFSQYLWKLIGVYKYGLCQREKSNVKI